LKAVEPATDERLAIEAAQRDQSRLAELYENNFERVYTYIARRVGNREEAQDLTAEVFYHALANIGHYEWRGVPFVGWLYRIAANAIADRWNRAVREGQRGEDDSAMVEEIGVNDEIERRAMLFQLVDSLPPDQRLVITRRFVDQRSIREIAAELKRSEGAVKQLQFRALHTLRAHMRSRHG
jgi:RNA polymerase sigma-70 factor, ECF subfamily